MAQTQVNQAQLLAPTAMANADANIYTVAALTTIKIGRAIFCNTDTAPHALTVNITTGTSTAANTVISARTLSPGETYVSPELAGQVLPAASSLRGFANTLVSVTISGLTITGN